MYSVVSHAKYRDTLYPDCFWCNGICEISYFYIFDDKLLSYLYYDPPFQFYFNEKLLLQVLCNIQVFAKAMPSLFSPYFEDFYISSSDSYQIKGLKLEILSSIATDLSISFIFQEFQVIHVSPLRLERLCLLYSLPSLWH